MFLHGGVWHLLGNLLFLWVVGDNVEDEMGHFKFLTFYLSCGILAGLTHVAMNTEQPNSITPMMGASGAIAGVMGAYLLKHPTRSIYVFFYKILLPLPAWFAVGAWFVLQIFGGLGRLGPSGEGIAYAAHIGGFFAGLLLVNLFANPRAIDDHVTREELVRLYRKEHPQSRGADL
jgi:membrane associated rhomboid family serine protease